MARLCAWVLGATMAFPAAAQVQPTIVPPTRPAQPAAVTDAVQRAAIKPIQPKKVILVGDSTTQVGSGWGGAFCADHLASIVSCVDLARGGRGTFDYRAERSWDLALGEMRVPGYTRVYVLIQFGHNDQPGKPGRSTDLRTEYPDNLRRYVRETRAAGAIPVLVTPLTRRSFRNKSLQDDLHDWSETVRRIANEEKVPMVDLNAASMAAVQAMGAQAATTLAQIAPPPVIYAAAASGTTIAAPKAPGAPPAPPQSTEVLEPQGRRNISFDYTHLGPKGAALFASQVAAGLARVVPDLRGDLIP